VLVDGLGEVVTIRTRNYLLGGFLVDRMEECRGAFWVVDWSHRPLGSLVVSKLVVATWSWEFDPV